MEEGRLTIADDIDIVVVVAVVDTPAGEATIGQVGLVALAVDLGQPDHSTAIAISGTVAGPYCLRVVEHSVCV